MPTNADLQKLIDDLARRVSSVEGSMKSIEGRMDTYEKLQSENTLILKRVEATVNGYETIIKNFFDFLKRFLKWCAGVAAIVVAGLIIAYFTAHFIHP